MNCRPWLGRANDQEIDLSDLAFAMELEDDARCHQESPCLSDPASRSCQPWWQVERSHASTPPRSRRASRGVALLHLGKRQDVSGAYRYALSAMAYGRARDVFTRQTSCMEARMRWKEVPRRKLLGSFSSLYSKTVVPTRQASLDIRSKLQVPPTTA